MDASKLLRTGIMGSIVAAVCCSIPVLTLLLGALGLSAWLAWADYALIAALAGFVGLTGYAAYRLRQRGRQCRRGPFGETP
ncbi:MAG: mercury resistance system transport protein MerF [Candidatus Rokuibacteriota bacterium]